MFDCERYFACWTYWGGSSLLGMSNVGVANTKSGDYHFVFSISSVACWPFTYGLLNMVELILCLIILRFLPFLEYRFVNEWFSVGVWNFCIGYMFLECLFFFSFVYPCCILTFDSAKHAISKWCTGRKWHIPMAVMRRTRVGGLGWQYGTR